MHTEAVLCVSHLKCTYYTIHRESAVIFLRKTFTNVVMLLVSELLELWSPGNGDVQWLQQGSLLWHLLPAQGLERPHAQVCLWIGRCACVCVCACVRACVCVGEMHVYTHTSILTTTWLFQLVQ